MRHAFYLGLLIIWAIAAYWPAQTDNDLYMPFGFWALMIIYYCALRGQPLVHNRFPRCFP